MIKENQKRLNRLHILLDALVIFLSYLIAYLIMYYNDDALLALSAQEYTVQKIHRVSKNPV